MTLLTVFMFCIIHTYNDIKKTTICRSKILMLIRLLQNASINFTCSVVEYWTIFLGFKHWTLHKNCFTVNTYCPCNCIISLCEYILFTRPLFLFSSLLLHSQDVYKCFVFVFLHSDFLSRSIIHVPLSWFSVTFDILYIRLYDAI